MTDDALTRPVRQTDAQTDAFLGTLVSGAKTSNAPHQEDR